MANQNLMSNDRIGVAIPAYRDARRLARCLNSIAACDPKWLSFVVITDDSGDGSVAQELRDKFPDVTWIVHEHNQGFARAANVAVTQNPCELVLLLNDDCEVVRDPRAVISVLFTDPALFAVGLRTVNKDGREREGAKRVVWRFGIAKVLHNAKDQYPAKDDVQSSDYAVGGHAVFRRSIFAELGGFDESFHPFYWEDVDLSQRAKHKGYRVVFAQDTEIRHGQDGAIRSTNQRAAIRRATWTNRLRFSERHARGLHKLLLPLARLWLSLQARLGGDTAMSEALRDSVDKSNQ